MSKQDFIYGLTIVVLLMVASLATGQLIGKHAGDALSFQKGVYCGVLAVQQEAMGQIKCGDPKYAECLLENAVRIRAEYLNE